PDHASTLTYMNNLAQTLKARGRPEEAEPLYRKVLGARRGTAGPTGRDTLISMVNLGLCLRDLKRPEEGLPLLEEASRGLASTLPADHWMIPGSKAYVGECLTALGRYAEAETAITGAYNKLVSVLGPGHVRTRNAAKSAVQLYQAWGKADKVAE